MASTERKRCEALFDAMSAVRADCGQAPPAGRANATWVESEAAAAIAAAERLRAYRAFLDAARDRKARHGSSPGFEREVIGQARRAQDDLRALGGATLRIVRHLETTGLLGEAVTAVGAALRTSGGVAAADLFADIVEDETGAKALRDMGLSVATLEAMIEAIGPMDVTIEADDAGLRVKSGKLGRDVRLAPGSGSGTASSPGALIFGGLYDAALAHWDEPGRFPFDVAEVRPRWPGEPVTRDPLDGVLGAVIAGRREMARHVRKLEDTGLATYAGRDPATVGLAAVVLAGIASVATLAGAVIKVTCAASQSLTPSSPFCRIGDFLLAFGLLLFAAAAVLGVIALILQTAASASSG